ncbi:MAG: nucleotidyltransferase family protein [Runella sp.]
MKNFISYIKNKLADFWKDKPVKKAYVFGSIARGDFTSDSDIDILVEWDKDRLIGMIEYIKIMDSLENIFNKKIDLVATDGISEHFKSIIDKEKILIYEA